MTGTELNEAVEAVLGQVPLDGPVTASYCTAVRDALRSGYLQHLTDQVYSMEVYHRHDQLLISIWLAPIDRENKIRGQWTVHRYTYPLS